MPVSGMEGINLLETPTEPLLTSWYVGLKQGVCAGPPAGSRAHHSAPCVSPADDC